MGNLKLKMSSDEIFQLKISLLGSEPENWRTIQISSDATLSRLHKAIQSSFSIGKIVICMNSLRLSMKRLIKDKKLKDLLRVGKKNYIYI